MFVMSLKIFIIHNIEIMNKIEFIEFLNNKSEESVDSWNKRWIKAYENSDDYWKLHKPGVDSMGDWLDLEVENIVKISYNQHSSSNDSQVFETTYNEFVKNHDKFEDFYDTYED
jgi:hypothetical protein